MDMIEGRADSNQAAATDELLTQIADYVLAPPQFSDEARATAALCLLDSIGCALEALEHPQCVAHLGPLVPGATMATGARVIGTGERLDPAKAAFDNGALLRWLDFNDTWLAAEWGHPSDNFAGLLGLADFMCRNPGVLGSDKPVTVEQLLELAIQAYEIQGVLALANSFNRVGLDHVLLVKVASAAVAAKLAGGGASEITSAVSHAWIDGQSLRTYRHAPNTSQRKSWAAGDAASRGVRLALMAVRSGLPALPSALSAPQWGFADVLFNSRLPVLERELGCYVMENILFKVAYPAEFHSQTAVECAVELHPQVSGRLDQIDKIQIRTQEAAVRIISKTGPLRNYADRDHCIQYMVAVALLEGDLRAEHYSDAYARSPQIDQLRERTVVQEDKRYSADYLDPDKRSIANAVKVWFADGSSTPEVEVEYPLGHRRRRDQARSPLLDKYRGQAGCLDQARRDSIEQLLAGRQGLAETTVAELVDMTCR